MKLGYIGEEFLLKGLDKKFNDIYVVLLLSYL